MPLPKDKAVENLKLAWQSPRIGKHGSPKKKLLAAEIKEELFSQFLEAHIEKWSLLVKRQLEDALTDRAAREYVFNQILGKPVERHKLQGTTDMPTSLNWQQTMIQLVVGEHENKEEPPSCKYTP